MSKAFDSIKQGLSEAIAHARGEHHPAVLSALEG